MSSITKHYMKCDRCGAEHLISLKLETVRVTIQGPNIDNNRYGIDLCSTCAVDLHNFLLKKDLQ